MALSKFYFFSICCLIFWIVGEECAHLRAADLSSKSSTVTPSDTTSTINPDKVPQKNPSSSLKVISSQGVADSTRVRYEEQISESLFVQQENSWNNPSAPVSASGIEARNIRKYKNSNVWTADWLIIDKVHLGASSSLDRQFEQGDASKQYQIGKNVYVKWKLSPSTELQSGQYTYSMFGEDWGTSSSEQYYIQARQKIASTPLTLQLKPSVSDERVENSDTSLTFKNGKQLESGIDWQINPKTTWTLGSQWKSLQYKNSTEVETTSNLYSAWNINPSSNYNFNFSTTFEKYRKEDEDPSTMSSTSNKFTLQFGQKFKLDDNLTAAFDVWQSTITHATSDIDATREHAATVSLQKKF